MPPNALDAEMQQDQQLWLENLKTGTELALTQAQVFQTTKIETIQAFVAYLVGSHLFRSSGAMAWVLGRLN